MSTRTLRVGSLRLGARELQPGITQIRLSNRWSRLSGFPAACYLVDDLLIDTGFAHAREPLLRFLGERPLGAICLTHHHEDHAGNCGALADAHGCPVYLRDPERLCSEGLGRLKTYRRLWWGRPQPYSPLDMPSEIRGESHALRAVPTPGHAATHVAFFEEAKGIAFVGDLFISPGAAAVMSHEDPYESVRSLRRVARFEPERLCNGHGLVIEQPAGALREKADRIEEASDHVLGLHDRGLPDRQITKMIFENGRFQDWYFRALTVGEFSRLNFVRACIRHRPRVDPG